MRTRTREQWNHTLAEKPCQPFTRPRVYPLQSFTNFESLSPVAVSCSAFQQAFHFEARCRELRKRGSILRDSRRCGNPFFQLFLKDGASLHVQGSSIRKASIVFPVQLYASTILPSIERISSCALPSITLSAMKPPQPLDPSLPSYGIARCLSITCPKTNRGKAHMPSPDYMLIRLCSLESIPSRTAVRS